MLQKKPDTYSFIFILDCLEEYSIQEPASGLYSTTG